MRITVPYKNVSSKDEAIKKIKQLLEADPFAQYGLKCDVSVDEDWHQAEANGKGFDVKMECLDEEAVVDIELSFLLKPFKDKIAKTIEKQAGRLL